MDEWTVIFVVFGAVTLGMIGAGWAQLLEHHRRKQALEVIKSAIEAGKEPPRELYALISKADAKAPWGEVVVFTALSFGFWIAFAQAEGGERTAFLVVAATMTITALGCLGLALLRPGRSGKDDESA
ncbi:MAG: hypothetical protein AB7T59_04420 [Hyphomonadaceae bacterium]